VLRGDYARLETFQEGFGVYDNADIRARRFDLALAREHLEAAGWRQRGPDGILVKDGVRLELRVTYGSPHHTPRLVILKEEARKAGIDLVLQLMDGASAFKQMQEKKHQIAWMGWNTSGVAPRYWEHFHSVNAHRVQTNNITNHDDPKMDALIDEYRASTEKARRIELARELEQMVHDSGSVIPTFKVPYTREAAWRWIRLPENLGTRTTGTLFNPLALSAGMYSAGGLFWIDVPLKQEIRDAKRRGDTYPPVLVINEQYRR
jgi:microcin C transport system substrate-binding protein